MIKFGTVYYDNDKKSLLEVKRDNLDFKKYTIENINEDDFIVGVNEYDLDYNKKKKNTVSFLEALLSTVDFSKIPGKITSWENVTECIDKKRLVKLHNKYGWPVDLINQTRHYKGKRKDNDLITGIRIKDISKRIIILSLINEIIFGIKENNIYKIDMYGKLIFQYFDGYQSKKNINRDYPLDLELKETYEQYFECKKKYESYSIELKKIIDKLMVIYMEPSVKYNLINNDVLNNKIMALLNKNYPNLDILNKEKVSIYFLEYHKYYAKFTAKQGFDDLVNTDYSLHLILKEDCEQYFDCEKIYESYTEELQDIIKKLMTEVYFDSHVRLCLIEKAVLDEKIMALLNTNYPNIDILNKEKVFIYFSKYYKYYALVTAVQGFDDFYSRYKQLNYSDKMKVLKVFIQQIINDETINIRFKTIINDSLYYHCDDSISIAYFNYSQILLNFEAVNVNVRKCPYCNHGIIIGNNSKKSCDSCNRGTRHKKKTDAINRDIKNGLTLEELVKKYNNSKEETSSETIMKIISSMGNE